MIFAFAILSISIPNAFTSQSFHGTSSIERFPQVIDSNEPQIIEIKFQYHEGPYSLNIEPMFEVNPEEATPFVDIEFEELEGVPRMSVKRMIGTITVDQNIPSEKIFLSISYNGTYSIDPPQPFKSSWNDSLIIDIEKNLVPEPDQDIPVYENCGLGTTLQDGICVVDESQETQSFELEDMFCSHPRGVQVDENCNVIRPSPYSQQKDGTTPEDVKCNRDLYRGYKISDGTAFCASGHALNELISRSYAFGFDSITSATVSGSNNVVNEYCPSSQELLQWGWYAYKNPTDIVVTNIDLVYSVEEDSNGVEFTFEKPTEGKSMLWVFVECDDHFDTFEVIILPETIEHRKNFVVYYPDNPNTTFRFVNQDTIPYKIDGVSDNGKNSFSIWIDPQDDWLIDKPPSSYEGVNSFALSAANPDTEEIYEWMNYIIYISENR